MNATLTAWTIDFIRAFMARPRVIRWLVYLLIGKFAHHELNGLFRELNRLEFIITDGYDLKTSSYHNDKDLHEWR